MSWENKQIQPFTFYCQKILPLVYDESLSYYETLCKIQKVLNEVIGNQNNLNNAFTELLNYVNTQLETYAKEQLEEWLDDGTLVRIINESLLRFKIVYMSDYVIPDGNNDNTLLMQQAIDDSEGYILVFNGNSNSYRCNQLNLKSNTTYIFEKNTTIKANDGWITHELNQNALIMLSEINNVKIYGNNAQITMNRSDTPVTEHANCLGLVGVNNVYVENLFLTNACGDGVYIDDKQNGNDLSDIYLYNIKTDNCARNGGSINGGKNIIIENCLFSNTRGLPPQAGFDIEPLERNALKCTNITFRNCIFEHNQTHGIKVTALDGIAYNIQVNIENCISNNNQFGFSCNQFTNSKGAIIFNNCIANNSRYCGYYDFNNDESVLRQFINCVSNNANTNNQSSSDATAQDGSGWGSDFYIGINAQHDGGNCVFDTCISNSPLAKKGFGVTCYPNDNIIRNVRLLKCLCNQDITNYGMRTTNNANAEKFTIDETLKRPDGTSPVNVDNTFSVIKTSGYLRGGLSGVDLVYKTDSGLTVNNSVFSINGEITTMSSGSNKGYLRIKTETKTTGYVISNWNFN